MQEATTRESVLTILEEMPPAPTRTIEWGRAWRAVWTLMTDVERTEQAFEVIDALSGRTGERLLQKFLATPEGRTLFAERPSLLAAVSDLDRLAAMPDGSFGRAYAELMRAAQIDAQGLVEASEASAAPTVVEVDAHREWFFDRVRDMHDLQHVLTGYGTDEAGELANLAFTYAQQPYPGMLLIVIAGVIGRPLPDGRIASVRYLFRAWRRGRRTPWLMNAPFERLLERPLAEVRWMLGIEPPARAHPQGIIVACRAAPTGAVAR